MNAFLRRSARVCNASSCLSVSVSECECPYVHVFDLYRLVFTVQYVAQAYSGMHTDVGAFRSFCQCGGMHE